jgi:hypothetical protein
MAGSQTKNDAKTGPPSGRKGIWAIWARWEYVLYKHTALVLTMMFILMMAGALWYLSRIAIELVHSAALQGSSLYADALEEVRKVYTSEVVDRVVDRVQVTHDYATREGAIPLPVTFSMELDKQVSKEATGLQAQMILRGRHSVTYVNFRTDRFTVLKTFRAGNHCDMQWRIGWRRDVSPVTTVILTAPRPTGRWGM